LRQFDRQYRPSHFIDIAMRSRYYFFSVTFFIGPNLSNFNADPGT
jgi:hypothetical protein